jgi:hypothetical protein
MSADDDEVRQALLAQGDDGRIARHTLFYFYGGDLAGLEHAARLGGFSASRVTEPDGLVVETIMSVDEASFEPVREIMDRWAIRFDAEYDGWECELQADG